MSSRSATHTASSSWLRSSSPVGAGDVTAGQRRARGQVVTPGVDGGNQGRADRGRVSDPRIDPPGAAGAAARRAPGRRGLHLPGPPGTSRARTQGHRQRAAAGQPHLPAPQERRLRRGDFPLAFDRRQVTCPRVGASRVRTALVAPTPARAPATGLAPERTPRPASPRPHRATDTRPKPWGPAVPGELEHCRYRTVTREEIDRPCLRGPDVQAHPVVAGTCRAGLLGDGLADPPHEIGVPRRAEVDRLRVHGGLAHPGDAGRVSWPVRKAAMPRAFDGGRDLVR